jgi:hypothetical protein
MVVELIVVDCADARMDLLEGTDLIFVDNASGTKQQA